MESKPQRKSLSTYAAYAAVLYLVFWFGGLTSYHETHECVRTEVVGTHSRGSDAEETEVCVYWRDNGRNWGILTPLTSVVRGPWSPE